MYDLIAWHEDVLVQGPPLAEVRASLEDTSLAHLEMMQALAGKRDELIKERQMEGLFNTLRGRPATLIFTHEQGAAWDVITLDAWRCPTPPRRRRVRQCRCRRRLHAEADFDAPRHAGAPRQAVAAHG